MKRWVSGSFYLLLALQILGCSIAEPPRLLSISSPAAFRPKTPQQVKNLEDAMAAIVTVCSQDLGLPVVHPLYIHLYKDANAYAAYTFGFARMPEAFVRLTLAVPQQNRLHINTERTKGHTWGGLLRLLAHEYSHIVEYAIVGSATPWSQWQREGFAEWISAKVLDSLGWESYASSLARAERALARYGASAPRLSQLEQTPQWVSAIDQPKGKVRAYGLAFLAVHRLIEKRGLPVFIRYFREENFQGNFGLSWGEFEAEMRATVNKLVQEGSAKKSPLRDEGTPELKAGFRWQYLLKGPGVRAPVTGEVVREDTFDGVPAYLLKFGNNEYLYTKDRLAHLATLSGGKALVKNRPPFGLLSGPLEAGKTWKHEGVTENVLLNSSRKIETEAFITAVETVKVPAGAFEAFRIETYAYRTGELISEQWYAPQVKWFAKTKAYRDDGVIEQELTGYKVD